MTEGEGATRRGPRARLLARLRRGRRTVLLTQPYLRLGNLLYFWLRADLHQRRGVGYVVRHTTEMDPWLRVLPRVATDLTIPRTGLRFLDNREHIAPRFFQRFGVDFAREDVAEFVERMLLPTPLFDSRPVDDLVSPTSLTVNVRRGDYYADAGTRSNYGFDVASYLRVALERSIARDGPVDRLHVVSDDVAWCLRELPWLADHARRLTVPAEGDGAAGNFVDVARSRRLIITNSTFSYWGAYVSTVIHGDNQDQVWAPRFFARAHDGGRPWQLDDRWSVVEELPGGW